MTPVVHLLPNSSICFFEIFPGGANNFAGEVSPATCPITDLQIWNPDGEDGTSVEDQASEIVLGWETYYWDCLRA